MKTNLENDIAKTDLNTMVDCMNALVKKGFDEDFKAKDAGLMSLKTNQVYQPEDVKILNFYRFEGESDPADNSILYAIETSDGKRGTLVDAYGPYADRKVTNFIHQVEEISKITDRSTQNDAKC